MPQLSKRAILIGLLLIVLIASGVYVFFFHNKSAATSTDKSGAASGKSGKGPSGPVTVSVANAEERTVPVVVSAIGNVEPHATVSLKARVDGQIMAVNFKEGDPVRKGAVLFRIDSRPYEATLKQAEATALRDAAARDQARSQERRYLELLEKNFVSKEAYAQIRTNAETAEATALASRAAVENARLNVEYCSVTAPIDGYVGKILLQVGNLVKANDVNALLVVINEVRPIYVSFAVPEQQLGEIRGYMNKGSLQVDAVNSQSLKKLATGALVFIDNAVDANTGTIRMRARFDNKDTALWPGQFVGARLRLYERAGAIVVPSRALQTGPQGQYVYVVKADMSAEMRKVVVAWTEGDEAVLSEGLAKDEQVVVRGALRVSPGAKVIIAPAAGAGS
jgi:multidrug efflux system membrane fusion protein